MAFLPKDCIKLFSLKRLISTSYPPDFWAICAAGWEGWKGGLHVSLQWPSAPCPKTTAGPSPAPSCPASTYMSMSWPVPSPREFPNATGVGWTPAARTCPDRPSTVLSWSSWSSQGALGPGSALMGWEINFTAPVRWAGFSSMQKPHWIFQQFSLKKATIQI